MNNLTRNLYDLLEKNEILYELNSLQRYSFKTPSEIIRDFEGLP